MSKQVPLHQYLISIACTAFLVGGASYIYFDQQYQHQTAEVKTTSELAEVESLYEEIQSNYVGDVDKKALVQGALKGMTSALDDPYSSYLSGDEAQELDETISGSFEGIGTSLSMENERPTVSQAPVSGSPAEKAGLRTGDVIQKIDDESVSGLSLNEVVKKIRGPKDTQVKLEVARDGETFSVAIKRDTIPVDTVIGELDHEHPTIGKIRITTFGETTSNELIKTVDQLRKEGAEKFILDLRQNPGGLLNQVQQIASMFLEDGKTVVQFEDKQGNRQAITAGESLDKGYKITEPVAVLVDGGSASAAEIFAAALKESAGRPVIGTQTFGKGTVQTVKALNGEKDGEIKLTILKWLTPDGEWLHEKGLEPTIKADYPEYAYLAPISRENSYRIGDTSDEVSKINQVLAALGHKTTGKEFTEVTRDAVMEEQKRAELDPTGVVDNQTATALEQGLVKQIQAHDVPYETAVKELMK